MLEWELITVGNTNKIRFKFFNTITQYLYIMINYLFYKCFILYILFILLILVFKIRIIVEISNIVYLLKSKLRKTFRWQHLTMQLDR